MDLQTGPVAEHNLKTHGGHSQLPRDLGLTGEEITSRGKTALQEWEGDDLEEDGVVIIILQEWQEDYKICLRLPRDILWVINREWRPL